MRKGWDRPISVDQKHVIVSWPPNEDNQLYRSTNQEGNILDSGDPIVLAGINAGGKTLILRALEQFTELIVEPTRAAKNRFIEMAEKSGIVMIEAEFHYPIATLLCELEEEDEERRYPISFDSLLRLESQLDNHEFTLTGSIQELDWYPSPFVYVDNEDGKLHFFENLEPRVNLRDFHRINSTRSTRFEAKGLDSSYVVDHEGQDRAQGHRFFRRMGVFTDFTWDAWNPKDARLSSLDSDPDEMTVKQLRESLQEWDLEVSGKKAELVDRLQAVIFDLGWSHHRWGGRLSTSEKKWKDVFLGEGTFFEDQKWDASDLQRLLALMQGELTTDYGAYLEAGEEGAHWDVDGVLDKAQKVVPSYNFVTRPAKLLRVEEAYEVPGERLKALGEMRDKLPEFQDDEVARKSVINEMEGFLLEAFMDLKDAHKLSRDYNRLAFGNEAFANQISKEESGQPVSIHSVEVEEVRRRAMSYNGNPKIGTDFPDRRIFHHAFLADTSPAESLYKQHDLDEIFDEALNKFPYLIRRHSTRKLFYYYHFRELVGPGFQFSPDNNVLPYLSSGQARMASILDRVLELEPGTTILIDEPELSLHIDWQRSFIKKVKTFLHPVVIATHSPDIIYHHPELVVEVPPQGEQ